MRKYRSLFDTLDAARHEHERALSDLALTQRRVSYAAEALERAGIAVREALERLDALDEIPEAPK